MMDGRKCRQAGEMSETAFVLEVKGNHAPACDRSKSSHTMTFLMCLATLVFGELVRASPYGGAMNGDDIKML